MPEIAAIIPARWGSTRFPGKPLHRIGGKPLIQHVWERACRARGLSEVLVATDDERIAAAVAAFGGTAVMTSTRHRSGTDRIAEVVRGRAAITHVLNVQGDEPFIEPALLTRLARVLVAGRFEMVTAATPFAPGEDQHNPHAVKVVLDRAGDALYFSRHPIPYARGAFRGPWLRHVGLYGYTRAFLLRLVRWRPTPLEEAEQLEQLRALEHGARIRVILTRAAAFGVDTPEDAARANRMLNVS